MKIPFFPKKQLLFRTALSEAEVLARLDTHLQRSKAGAFVWPPEDTFVGEIKGANFYIHERIGIRDNMMTPGISGTVGRDEKGTFIRIVLQFGGCVQAFILVWCYVPVLLLFLSLLGLIRDGEKLNAVPFVALAALLFMYLMSRYAFKSGTGSAQLFMTKTFEGELLE